MSNYNRRGNDLSLFMRELNTIPNEPAEDFAALEPENFDLFTNTNFFDFDTGTQSDFKPDESTTTSTKPGEPASSTRMMGDLGMVDYMDSAPPSATDINFDFQSYASPIDSNFSGGIGYQASPQSAYPHVPAQHGHQQHPAYSHHGVSQGAKVSEKHRPAEPQISSRPMNIEEASRVAAEEDKRRRNTAASARFRVKKKQREQALEKSAKEMSDRVQALEAKITQLETENTWLKKLILEKNDGTSITSKDGTLKSTTNGTENATGKAEDGKKEA